VEDEVYDLRNKAKIVLISKEDNPWIERLNYLKSKEIRAKWAPDEISEIERQRNEIDSLKENNKNLLKEITFFGSQLAELTRKINGLACTELRILSEEEIRSYVMTYIRDLEDGAQIYPGDIAIEYGIDMDCLEKVMDKMMDEGLFR
jgi:uncharacterized protein YnzC (UPF0291/DUF896 family)